MVRLMAIHLEIHGSLNRMEFVSQKLVILLIVGIVASSRASPVNKRQVYPAAGPVTHYEDTIAVAPFAEYGRNRHCSANEIGVDVN